ncbi:hypothetical protein VNI00_010729 [Paramarasmius palmivorus]|uniref:Uncharacterized protein n=1 Tax=Paramarasmius palmivorus TaxID=297713 RepID=A0AAW0CIF7_9AGAR
MTSTSSSPDVPPFHGYVETTVNALRLIHAARQGVIPRITRRLNDTERRSMIKSGAVFIFSVEESGIKRWTDGLLWSPSRIVGNFLVYREINERASSRGSNHKKTYTGDDSRALSIHRNSPGLSAGYKSSLTSGSDQGTFKPGGLIKKTITVTIEGSDLHLISYYTSEDIRSGRLKRPSSRPDIMSLYMPPHIFRLTNFRVPPKVEMGPDGKPRLVPEPEEDMPECKVEEQTYPSPTHSHSSASSINSPIDNTFPGNQLYPLQHATSSSTGYSRNSAQDRWQVDPLRAPTPLRQEGTWPMPTGSGHSSHSTSRRETSLTDPWSPHSNRWQNESYDSSASVPSPDLTSERHRVRSSHHPYQNAAAFRDHDTLPSFGNRYPSFNRSTREVGSPRLSWLPHGDVPAGDKDSNRTLSSARSYTSSSSLPFASDNYQYSTSWGSNEPGSNLDVSPPTSYSQPNLQNYTYSSNSGTF